MVIFFRLFSIDLLVQAYVTRRFKDLLTSIITLLHLFNATLVWIPNKDLLKVKGRLFRQTYPLTIIYGISIGTKNLSLLSFINQFVQHLIVL